MAHLGVKFVPNLPDIMLFTSIRVYSNGGIVRGMKMYVVGVVVVGVVVNIFLVYTIKVLFLLRLQIFFGFKSQSTISRSSSKMSHIRSLVWLP